MFKLAGDKAVSLTVLKPLIFDNKIKLITAVQQWKTEIKTLNLTRDRENKLLELLEYAIVQRFPGLTSEEVQTTLKLTPIDQTVIGRELLNRGREDGREEGEKKGILIGEILMAQRLLKYPFSAKEELTIKSIEELQDILRQLESGIE